jgi:hypothetical protein
MRQKFVKLVEIEENRIAKTSNDGIVRAFTNQVRKISREISNIGRRVSSGGDRGSNPRIAVDESGILVGSGNGRKSELDRIMEDHAGPPPKVTPAPEPTPIIVTEQRGNSAENPKFLLLHELEKELFDLMDSDIIPRWIRKTEVIESFFSNEPYESVQEEQVNHVKHNSASKHSVSGVRSLISAQLGTIFNGSKTYSAVPVALGNASITNNKVV